VTALPTRCRPASSCLAPTNRTTGMSSPPPLESSSSDESSSREHTIARAIASDIEVASGRFLDKDTLRMISPGYELPSSTAASSSPPSSAVNSEPEEEEEGGEEDFRTRYTVLPDTEIKHLLIEFINGEYEIPLPASWAKQVTNLALDCRLGCDEGMSIIRVANETFEKHKCKFIELQTIWATRDGLIAGGTGSRKRAKATE